jgi:DNA-binding winged helix-turn-helix (wHTH) protein
MKARFGQFVLDTETRQLLHGDEPLHLTPKAFALLEYLIERRPRALSKSQIFERVWPATFVAEANLASLVKEIRRTLGDDADAPRVVRTVHGFGYAFAAEVVIEDTRPGAALTPTREAAQTEFRVVWDRREIALTPGDNVLGRTRQAAVWVEHASVSRRHAIIRIAGERAALEDCGSKNGTFLRGERLDAPASLSDGDEILLGRARLVFRAHPAEPPTATDPDES